MNYLKKITENKKENKSVEKSEETETEKNSEFCICSEILGTFFFSRSQTHFWHLVTESYAEHKALNKYYEKIIDLLDDFAESYQANHGRIKKPVPFGELLEYSSENVKNHFKTLCEKCDEFRSKIDEKDNDLLAILDDIKILVTKTSYLLTLS